MIGLVLLALLAVTAGCVAWSQVRADRTGGRLRPRLRHRLKGVKLPQDWWAQFERDFAEYADPRAARARNREQH